MKLVLQSQATECSLAALAMVAGAHGLSLDLADLRQRFQRAIKGINLNQVIANAACLGFTSRPLRLDLIDFGKLQLPCILHWDFNHFVVLKKVHGQRAITVLDPAVGERRLAMSEVSCHFTGVALELTPDAEFVPGNRAPRLKLSQLTGKVRGILAR